MKKRLLVVDDEIRVLSGIRRALHSHSHHWSMNFVKTGDEAIKSQQITPYDVLISDYRMPGMDGYELLSWFRENAPETLRITLTGQVDRVTYLKNLELSHYFIWKPAHGTVIGHILERIIIADRFLPPGEIRFRLQNIVKIPTLKTSRQQLQSLLREEHTNYDELSELIASDIGLAAMILRILYTVNPSGKEFESLLQGLHFLGSRTLREILLDSGLLQEPPLEDDASRRLRTLNEHSRKVAHLAQRLMSQSPRKEQFKTYVAALLHNLGTLLIGLCCPDEYAEILRLHGTRFVSQMQAEHEALGCSHADIGGFMTYLWGFPEEVCTAISHHHIPSDPSATCFPIAEAVWHANRISHGRLGRSTRQYEMLMASGSQPVSDRREEAVNGLYRERIL